MSQDSSADVLDRSRSFARAELVDRHDVLDAGPEPPLALHRQFHRQGLANWWLPREHGGSGLGLRDSVDVAAELAYGDAGVAFTQFISIIATTVIELYATPELRTHVLRRLGSSGGYLATLGSERAAGSELANLTTIAVRSGDHVDLTGEKMFSTNAGFAEHLLVIARDQDNPLRHLAVVVPRTTPGVDMVKRWDTIGVRSAATYEVTFDRCRVPAANVLAGPGLQLLEIGLNPSRVLIAATAVGIARRIRDLCLEYAHRL